LHSAHTTRHTTLHLNKNREAIRRRKLPTGRDRYGVPGGPPEPPPLPTHLHAV
jgi:hypothetical protein